MKVEPKTTDDYIFYNRYGKVLDEESLTPGQVEEHAKRIARRHRCAVTVAAVVYISIKPDVCPECGEVLPESGPCWCSSFEDETPQTKAEIEARLAEDLLDIEWGLQDEEIPFLGEPVAGPERTIKDYYGIE